MPSTKKQDSRGAVGPFKSILVGYDGSDNATRALDEAIVLASQSKGELRIVVVADSMRFAAYAGAEALFDQIEDKAMKNARSLTGLALDRARSAGLKEVYASAEQGQPADMLLSLATEYKADLIVVGRRGMRGLERFLLGSVSNAIINHASCDVLIVK